MGALIIAWYTLKRNFRNPVVFIFFIAAPLFIVFLVGKSVEGSASPATLTIGFHLDAVADGQQAWNLRALFQDTDTGHVSLRFREVQNLADGRNLLESGRLDELVDLRVGSSSGITAGIYTRRGFSAARGMLDRFADQLNAAAIGEVFQLDTAMPAGVMRESGIAGTGRTVSGLDAWSCGGILIFLFYGSLIGSNALIQDRKKRTYLRIHSAPLRSWADVAGKSLGNVLSVSVCAFLSVLASKFLYGAQWCALPLAAAAIFLFAAVANGFGMLLARFSRNMIVCAMIAFAVNFFFAVLAISPNYLPVLPFSPLNAVSPHYYAHLAVTNGICGGPAAMTAAAMGTLALMAAVLYALVLVGRKERAQ